MGRGIYPGAGHRGFATGKTLPAQQGHRVGSDVYNGTTERVFTNIFIKAVKHELKVESRRMRDEHRAPRRAQTQSTNLAMTTSGGCCALRQAGSGFGLGGPPFHRAGVGRKTWPRLEIRREAACLDTGLGERCRTKAQDRMPARHGAIGLDSFRDVRCCGQQRDAECRIFHTRSL